MEKPTLIEQMKKKILILDGAMGTMIQGVPLTEEDFGGEELDGCNEMLVLTRPDVITQIHEEYLEAGADLIETNTFGATGVVLAEYDIADKSREINLVAAKLAVDAVRKYSTPEWPRYAVGAIGPTTKTLSVTGGVTFEQLIETYHEQALALIEGGVDALLLETCQDTLNVKAASIGLRQAMKDAGKELPVMISGTIEPMGTTLSGQNAESFYISLEHLKPISIGLNCATGPEFMRDHIRSLSQIAGTAISCYPNAGLPDENGHYHESPESLAKKMVDFAEQGWLNIAGGCCGTTPEHIRVLSEMMSKYTPRQEPGSHPAAVSGIETVFVEPDTKPLMVGERTNVLGSPRFKKLIAEGKYEEAAEVARAQVRGGAHVIDVSLQDAERDEVEDITNFMQELVKKVKAPIVIDTTNHEAVEAALKYSQGKAIINSVNLEEGEERIEKIAPLVHRYGAALVFMTIDEEGQSVSSDKRLAVAKRGYEILTKKYGIPPQDIIFDPMVFPIGTGDSQYLGSGSESLEAVRKIKEAFPESHTMMGVSNVSFALPLAGREVLNSVYLYHCTKAGLDYAIVNTQRLKRYASISEEERRLTENLIFNTNDETLAEFVAYFREQKVEAKVKTTNMTLEERLASYVVEGTKEGLIPDLEEARQKYAPLDIINGPLMKGMEEVGRLFNNNELIVAEVLQSAEVMKASVAHLEQFMEKSESSIKGKIILATVKGDVHDIGKNLVEIILSNNGYQIINLGIKVPPEQLIEAYRKEKPDAIGLSGLLVKSAQQMVVTAQDFKAAGIDVPLLVGGAALTRKFTKTRIAPEYGGTVLFAKDAMEGLSIANRLSNPEERQKLIDEIRASLESDVRESGRKREAPLPEELRPTRSNISQEAPVYIPPDCDRHILRDYPIPHLVPYVNPEMLIGKHLGVRGSVERQLQEGNPKVVEMKELVDDIFAEAHEKGIIQANGMYRFFPAQSSGNDIIVYDPQDTSKVLQRFSFPRQEVEPYLCLADFLKSVESGVMDYVGFLVVTAGRGIRQLAEELKEKGDYLRSHALQSCALESAEALAERIHHMMRDVWGISDPPEMTMKQRFGARYHGIRVSFGYPACPNLEDQKLLFELMRPEDIGIELTEEFMMDPEASVSAMVFAHPEAQYFNVGKV